MKNEDVSQTNVIIVTMSLSGLVLTAGSAAFSHYEDWSYINSFYYCFITLTTIGFGDFVALQKPNDLQQKPHYVTFSIFFILFGLTVISAAMNLLVLRFLTMNTEDERRDELEAAAAAQTAVRLDGDVITSSANGNIVSQAQENPEYNDQLSVCSCSCYNLRSKNKHRYKVTRSPSKITHLLPMKKVNRDDQEDIYSFVDERHYSMFTKKRASV